MGLAFSRIWERMFGKKEMRSLQCINQIVATRLRHGSIMTSTPSTRRQLDGAALWSLTARFSQHGRVLAENGLSEELSGAPDSRFD